MASQVIDNTIYVWYGFIPIPVKTGVFAVTVTVMEIHTHGLPVSGWGHMALPGRKSGRFRPVTHFSGTQLHKTIKLNNQCYCSNNRFAGQALIVLLSNNLAIL